MARPHVMNCAECGEHLPAGARFCSACGRRVGDPATCPECNAQVSAGARFCFRCGTALGAAEKVEPVLDPTRLDRVAPAPAAAAEPALRAEPLWPSPPVVPTPPRAADLPAPTPAEPAIPSPAATIAVAPDSARRASRAWPTALVVVGALLGVAAIWAARVDDAAFQAEASRRMALATGALPSTTQRTTHDNPAFSTRQALQGLYGRYDPHLDGVFWTVTGAPGALREWNGRTVVIKPLISRTDASGTRHVLVTNSVDVKNGLVVKQGAGCRECRSLLGAALFERRADEWVLVQEQRFLRAAGAFGAPPKVAVDFPVAGGAEVRIESASADGGPPNAAHVAVLGGVQTRAAANTVQQPRETAPRSRETASPPRETAPPSTAGTPSARSLVSAAIQGEDAQFRAIAARLRAQQPPRGNRALARSLNDRGLALARRGEYAEAAAIFRQAYDADRGDAEIRENLGYALLKAGQVNDAEIALLGTLEIAPERASAWGSLGHVYAKRGKRAEAVALLRTAHRVSPDPRRVLDTYARQAETEEDPRIRALLAEAVTQIASAR